MHASALLLANLRPATRLAVPTLLSVSFGAEDKRHHAYAVLGAQALSASDSLQRLRQGASWAALVQAGADTGAAHEWLRQLRASGAEHEPAVVMLLSGADDAAVLSSLVAGADAVLPADASAALVGAQLDRLRQRLATHPRACLGDRCGLHIDGHTQAARVGTEPVPLKPQIFRLLRCLMATPQRVFSLQALHAAIGADATSQTESVHAYVSRLRKALRPHLLDGCIQTVHSVGYRYAPAVAPVAQARGAIASEVQTDCRRAA